MVLGKPMTTRVSQEAYKSLLQKCADRGCSTYEYLRQLVHEDVGLAEAAEEKPAVDPVAEPPEENKQTRLELNGRNIENRIRRIRIVD